MRSTAVVTVRNEGAFLIEWLAHHRGLGFTDIVVLSNDCDDGTDAMLDRLADMGEIHHLPNPGPHDGGIQFAGLKRADRHAAVTGADWLMALDIDEFVNIHVGDHTLAALRAALPEADAITLTWRLFGNCGVRDYADTPVTETFTRAAPEVMPWPWRAFMFKTLYRNTGAYRKLGVHRPRAPVTEKAAQTRWFDSHGRELAARVRTQGTFSRFGRPNYGLAQLNHYPLGAMESYIVKRDRGRAVHSDHALGTRLLDRTQLVPGRGHEHPRDRPTCRAAPRAADGRPGAHAAPPPSRELAQGPVCSADGAGRKPGAVRPPAARAPGPSRRRRRRPQVVCLHPSARRRLSRTPRAPFSPPSCPLAPATAKIGMPWHTNFSHSFHFIEARHRVCGAEISRVNAIIDADQRLTRGNDLGRGRTLKRR